MGIFGINGAIDQEGAAMYTDATEHFEHGKISRGIVIERQHTDIFVEGALISNLCCFFSNPQ